MPHAHCRPNCRLIHSSLDLQIQADLKLPLYIAAGTCAVNVLYITAFLPESLPPNRRRHDAGFKVRVCVHGLRALGRRDII